MYQGSASSKKVELDIFERWSI